MAAVLLFGGCQTHQPQSTAGLTRLDQQYELDLYEWHKKQLEYEKTLPKLENVYLPGHVRMKSFMDEVEKHREELEIFHEAYRRTKAHDGEISRYTHWQKFLQAREDFKNAERNL